MNSLHYSCIEELLIDFTNSDITSHIFYKQLNFLLQSQVTCGHINFQSDSCLAVTYSIHSQALVA